jgi:hypothetical protein
MANGMPSSCAFSEQRVMIGMRMRLFRQRAKRHECAAASILHCAFHLFDGSLDIEQRQLGRRDHSAIPNPAEISEASVVGRAVNYPLALRLAGEKSFTWSSISGYRTTAVL